MLDVFKADAFNVVSMTAAINMLPFKPGRLGAMGLFSSEGITTTTAVIEEKQGTLALIPTAARGTHPNVIGGDKRNARSVIVPHIPLETAVEADEVQGVRAFGKEDQVQTVAEVVNEKLAKCRQSHEVTLEYHRIGALKGIVLDADGTTELLNLFDFFGITQDSVEFDWGTSTVRELCLDIVEYVEAALGATPHTGIRAICGKTFFRNLITDTDVMSAYDRYQNGAVLRAAGSLRPGFEFGDITWETYRGAVGSVDFVDDEEAHFYPEGVPELFKTYFAPANFIETVNTKGKPVYAKQEARRFNTGVDIHTQSNPLCLCTRPKCLVKGTTAGSTSGS